MSFLGPAPALMVVEPESLCRATGRMAGSRDGVTWAGEFARLPALRAVVRDDGTGLGKGVRLDNARRRAASPPYARLGLLVASPDVMAAIPREILSRAIRSHADFGGSVEHGPFRTRHAWEDVVFFLRTNAGRERTRIWLAGE